MLTEMEMKQLTISYTFVTQSITVHFKYKNGRIILKQEHPFVRVLNWIQWFLVIGVFLYKLYQLPVVFAMKDIGTSSLNAVFLLVSLAEIMLKASTSFYYEELGQLISDMLNANSCWGSAFLNIQYIQNEKREKAFLSAILSVLATFTLTGLLTILAFDEPYSTYQLIANEWHWSTSALAFIVFMGVESLILIDLGVQSVLLHSTIFLCTASMNFWLQKACVEWPVSSSEPASIQQCIAVHKGIYLMNQNFNIALGRLYIPYMKLALMFGIVICLFGVARMHEELEPLQFLFLVVISFASLILLIPVAFIMSSLYELSTSFSRNVSPNIRTISDRISRRNIEMNLKSCQVIRCQVGNMYHMEAQAKMTMLDKVVNGLVFFMVNAKSSLS